MYSESSYIIKESVSYALEAPIHTKKQDPFVINWTHILRMIRNTDGIYNIS
jgi:hypothetical protein